MIKITGLKKRKRLRRDFGIRRKGLMSDKIKYQTITTSLQQLNVQVI
jgi:hypothetical protein